MLGYTEEVKKTHPLIRFGSYLLVRNIAAGGMADIYSARVTGMRGFSKSLAIRKIHPHLLPQVNFLNMFIDEAKIASKLVHPNIVQISELGQVGGQPFIAMEYVLGRDLFELLHRLRELSEPCPWPLAVRIALDMDRALYYAHEFCDADGRKLGIVHREVLKRAIVGAEQEGSSLTDFLIKEKILSPGKAFKNLSEQLNSRVLELFCWPDAEFFFFPEQLPAGQENKLCLETLNLVQIGVLEYLPLVLIRKYLGDFYRKEATLIDSTKSQKLSLAGRMQAILAALEKGPRPVAELHPVEGDESFSRDIFLLRELGLIRLGPEG